MEGTKCLSVHLVVYFEADNTTRPSIIPAEISASNLSPEERLQAALKVMPILETYYPHFKCDKTTSWQNGRILLHTTYTDDSIPAGVGVLFRIKFIGKIDPFAAMESTIIR